MPTFTYKAIDATGKNVRGTLVADSQQAALGQLGERALYPVEIIEGSPIQRSSLWTGQRRVKLRHLTTFYGQLADLLRAGVPMLRSLDVLGRQTSNKMLSEIVREIREDVAGGTSLADSMAKHPHVFKNLHVAMVRAGEVGGFLEDVLSRIAQFVERQDELRNKLIGSMIYPCILVVIGSGVIISMLTFVVPKLRPFIERAQPNVLTRIVFLACDVLQHYGVFLFGGLFVAVAVILAYSRTDAGRYKIDLWKLKMPVLGRTLVMIALCRFCRILGTLLKSGVPILQALRIAKDSADSAILAAEIDKAVESVQKGGTISQNFSQCALFPLDLVDMIAVAEESNSLDAVLVQIADTNETRTARMIDMGVRLVEPMLLVIIAGIVAMIAIALLVPILGMSAHLSGR